MDPLEKRSSADLSPVADNQVRPTARGARATLHRAVGHLGIGAAQDPGDWRSVLWGAQAGGVGEATCAIVLPGVRAQDLLQRLVQLSHGLLALADSLDIADSARLRPRGRQLHDRQRQLGDRAESQAPGSGVGGGRLAPGPPRGRSQDCDAIRAMDHSPLAKPGVVN